MALIKKFSNSPAAAASDAGKSSVAATRDSEAQRKRARTLAKQQQAAERIAAATAELSSGINSAGASAEEMKRVPGR